MMIVIILTLNIYIDSHFNIAKIKDLYLWKIWIDNKFIFLIDEILENSLTNKCSKVKP